MAFSRDSRWYCSPNTAIQSETQPKGERSTILNRVFCIMKPELGVLASNTSRSCSKIKKSKFHVVFFKNKKIWSLNPLITF